MKIKAGDYVYYPGKQPIMVVLTMEDKDRIRSMAPGDNKYAVFPTNWTVDERKRWMEENV